MICVVLRDLACDEAANENVENDVEIGAEAAQRNPMCAMWKSEECDSRTRQRHSFHKVKIFFGNCERASEIGDISRTRATTVVCCRKLAWRESRTTAAPGYRGKSRTRWLLSLDCKRSGSEPLIARDPPRACCARDGCCVLRKAGPAGAHERDRGISRDARESRTTVASGIVSFRARRLLSFDLRARRERAPNCSRPAARVTRLRVRVRDRKISSYFGYLKL
jgi:hypothetical protein